MTLRSVTYNERACCSRAFYIQYERRRRSREMGREGGGALTKIKLRTSVWLRIFVFCSTRDQLSIYTYYIFGKMKWSKSEELQLLIRVLDI